MVTAERFAQGMTAKEYLGRMAMNRERMLAAFQNSAIRPEDLAVLDRYKGTRKILAITEDWCGTSIGSLPHVMKLAEAAPDVELRIFLRDENPDIMDQYLKAGVYRSIPVYAFFDERMQELARFVERRPA